MATMYRIIKENLDGLDGRFASCIDGDIGVRLERRGKSGLRGARWWVTPTARVKRVGKVPQKTNRLWRLVSSWVRVKRRGKSSPAIRATGPAWQTPPGARPNKEARRRILRDRRRREAPARDRLPGRSLESSGDRRPREMIIRELNGSRQNPAYKPVGVLSGVGRLPSPRGRSILTTLRPRSRNRFENRMKSQDNHYISGTMTSVERREHVPERSIAVRNRSNSRRLVRGSIVDSWVERDEEGKPRIVLQVHPAGSKLDLVIVEASASLLPDRGWIQDLGENLCHGNPVVAIGKPARGGCLRASFLDLSF